jgi:excisionase family DNA binding protein
VPARSVNPNLVKRNRSHTAGELAALLGVHKNTVRNWQRDGLAAIDDGRPVLFHGEAVREFLGKRNARRKQPCSPGTFYCFRCRAPRPPALGMVECLELKPGTGNLRALCETCETIMHRRVRLSHLAAVMPGIDVQIREPRSRLTDRPGPSLNCDSETRGFP